MAFSWSGTMPLGWSDLEDGAAGRYRLSSPFPLLRQKGGRKEVRCCVRGCQHWLPARSRVTPNEPCPDHHVSISTSPTFVHRETRSNFIIGNDTLHSLAKVETWRLPNERSEDALSWNMFVSLWHLGLLPRALSAFGLQADDMRLYLWGNRVGGARPESWTKLRAVRALLERGIRFQTEPDVVIHAPGKFLLLIEAKLGSGNGTLKGKDKRFGTVEQWLSRYPQADRVDDPLDRQWISGQQPEGVLEQLCRNVIFATHLGGRGEHLVVANLVRDAAEPEVESVMRRHLASDSPVEFRRVTWEAVWHAAGNDERAAPLQHYLANKTLNLQRAFPSICAP